MVGQVAFGESRDAGAVGDGQVAGQLQGHRHGASQRARPSGGNRLLGRERADVAGGRNTGALAQVLGEALAAFELSGCPGGAEHRETGRAQRIGEPVDQRRFGTDDDQPDALFAAQGGHRVMIGQIERDQLGMLGDARIAGGRVELAAVLGEQPGLRELPGQRMFASARSQQQDVHARPFFRR